MKSTVSMEKPVLLPDSKKSEMLNVLGQGGSGVYVRASVCAWE